MRKRREYEWGGGFFFQICCGREEERERVRERKRELRRNEEEIQRDR